MKVRSNLFVLYLQKRSILEISSLPKVTKLISGRAGFKPRSIQAHFVSTRGAHLDHGWLESYTFLLHIWVTVKAAGLWPSGREPLHTWGWRAPMRVSTVSHCAVVHWVVRLVVSLDLHNQTQALGLRTVILGIWWEHDSNITQVPKRGALKREVSIDEGSRSLPKFK